MILRLDLLDFFRGRYSWAKLWRLVGRLPWDSQYKLALADDDEIADRALVVDERGGRPSPPLMAEWNELRDLRSAILDGLASVERTIIAVNTPRGKRVPEFRPQPRPETAAMRVARRRRDEAMGELEAKLTGT